MVRNPLDKSKLIIDRIIEDLSDRCGLGDEWDQIDDDIKDEIKEKWKDIVLDVLTG